MPLPLIHLCVSGTSFSQKMPCFSSNLQGIVHVLLISCCCLLLYELLYCLIQPMCQALNAYLVPEFCFCLQILSCQHFMHIFIFLDFGNAPKPSFFKFGILTDKICVINHIPCICKLQLALQDWGNVHTDIISALSIWMISCYCCLSLFFNIYWTNQDRGPTSSEAMSNSSSKAKDYFYCFPRSILK